MVLYLDNTVGARIQADQCVESFVLVLESVLDRMPQADQHPTGGTQPSSSTRIALAEAVCMLYLCADPCKRVALVCIS